ncbi:hypothetical protein YC2023_091898 [Brassica napus]
MLLDHHQSVRGDRWKIDGSFTSPDAASKRQIFLHGFLTSFECADAVTTRKKDTKHITLVTVRAPTPTHKYVVYLVDEHVNSKQQHELIENMLSSIMISKMCQWRCR